MTANGAEMMEEGRETEREREAHEREKKREEHESSPHLARDSRFLSSFYFDTCASCGIKA